MTKPAQTTFDEIKIGDKFYRGSAKNSLWMKVGLNLAARCEKMDGKVKVSVVEKAEEPVAPKEPVVAQPPAGITATPPPTQPPA